jgi:hypothetical protein
VNREREELEVLLFPSERGADFIHDSAFNKTWNKARVAAGVRHYDQDTKR